MAGMSISTCPKIHSHPFFVVNIVKVLKNVLGLHLSLSLIKNKNKNCLYHLL